MNQHLIDQKKAKQYAIKSNCDFHVKTVDFTKRIVTGFYNMSLYFDSDYDVILKGASDNSISQRGPASNAIQKIKHLMFHDWTLLPGKLQTLEERMETIQGQKMTGLYFETRMADTQLGNDTLINYQEGIYDNHSIGFRYLDGEWIDSEAEDWQKYVDMLVNPEDAEDAGFMYIWKEIKLYEGSTVAFGANAMTPYLGVKSGNKDALLLKVNERISLLTGQVKNGRQSDEMLHSFEMQLLQLNQIVTELFTTEPSEKDTLAKGRQKKDTPQEFDLSKAIQEIKFYH